MPEAGNIQLFIFVIMKKSTFIWKITLLWIYSSFLFILPLFVIMERFGEGSAFVYVISLALSIVA